MAVIVDNRIYEFRVIGDVDGQYCVNRLHYEYEVEFPGGSVPADLSLYLTDLRAKWRAQMVLNVFTVNYVATEYHLLRVSAVSINLAGKMLIGYDQDAVLQGGNPLDVGNAPGDPLPSFCTATVRKTTDLAGKHGRGYIRLSPIDEGSVTNNEVDAAHRTVIENAIGVVHPAVGINYAGNGTLHSVLFTPGRHNKINGTPNAVTPTVLSGAADYVTGTFCNRFVGSQVTRKRRKRLL